ncbi:MAG: CHRD domain-containing protein, partial [Opitutaceae bacterium]
RRNPTIRSPSTMKTIPTRLFAFAATLLIMAAVPSPSAVVRFTAAIDAGQETTTSTSAATGTAELLYDVNTNTFDLALTLNNFANTITASHIHEGAVGVAGGVVTNLGAETAYVRSGNTITATFSNVTHGGDPATLLRGDAYLNFHTAAFTAGEIRGQLIPEPVKLVASLDAGQEVAVVESEAFGAAQAIFDPTTNKITVVGCIYNFTNTLTDSHIHEAPVDTNGPVRTGFGGASAYVQTGTTFTQVFAERDWTGSSVALLSDGAYYNVHSNAYGGGEIRGQFKGATTTNGGRLINVSARGNVGSGEQALITGFIVSGEDPVRVLVTARGPVLTDFGVANAMADPVLSVYDVAGNLVFRNDDVADAPFAALITSSGLAPSETAEAGALLVLPPGAYTSVVASADAITGIALAEAFEVAW